MDVAGPEASNGISIYISPAINTVTIASSEGSLTISDSLGQIFEVQQTGNILDISALTSGVYLVNEGHSRAKFVKK